MSQQVPEGLNLSQWFLEIVGRNEGELLQLLVLGLQLGSPFQNLPLELITGLAQASPGFLKLGDIGKGKAPLLETALFVEPFPVIEPSEGCQR